MLVTPRRASRFDLHRPLFDLGADAATVPLALALLASAFPPSSPRQISSPHPTTPGMVDQAKLSEFLGVTGCDDPAKAQFFLESANGDLGAAVSAFYEHGDAPTDAPDPSPPSATAPTPAAGSAGAGPATAPAARPAPARASTAPRPTSAASAISAAATTTTTTTRSPRSGSPAARSPLGGAGSQKAAVQRRKTERVLDGARAAGAVRNPEDLEPRGRAAGALPPARDAPSDPPPADRRTRAPLRGLRGRLRLALALGAHP